MKITLCDENLGHVSVHVEAGINDGELLISGQDFGSLVGEIFKDSDYEYFYSFNKVYVIDTWVQLSMLTV